MNVITTKRSGMSQTQKDRIRKQRINNSHFDPAFIGEGGPINLVLHCGFVTGAYKRGYDNIKWNKPNLKEVN